MLIKIRTCPCKPWWVVTPTCAQEWSPPPPPPPTHPIQSSFGNNWFNTTWSEKWKVRWRFSTNLNEWKTPPLNIKKCPEDTEHRAPTLMLSGKFMKPGRCPDVDWCSSSLFPFYEWFESIFLIALFNIYNMKPGRCPDVDWWLYTYTYKYVWVPLLFQQFLPFFLVCPVRYCVCTVCKGRHKILKPFRKHLLDRYPSPLCKESFACW